MRMDYQNRNINIELLRIIACLFVLSIHLVPTYIPLGGSLIPGLFFYDAMTRVAVPVFFVITGYFWDGSKSLKKQYRRFLLCVLVPTLLFICVAGIVLPYILNGVLNMQEETISLRKAMSRLLAGEIDDFQFCFHLWYIVDLIKCYIFLPVLQMICSKGQHMQRVRRYLLLIGLYAGIIIPSLNLNAGEEFPTIFFLCRLPFLCGILYWVMK